jgi:secreted trypsin-like serine protease
MAASLHRLARLTGVALVVAAAGFASVSIATADSEPANVTPFIVGGTDATTEEFPFVVALTSASGFQFCGGTLAAPNKVVTAAHCTVGESPENIKVVAGRTTLSGSDGTKVDVTDIWVHPSYTDATQGFDVSVLTLASDVEQTPISLASTEDGALYEEGTQGLVLGWGTTSEGGSTSDTLQQATVPLTSDTTCSNSYNEYDPKAMVCAGYEEGGIDTCQGDSGGPLVAGGKLIGVTSWGNGCARAGFPGVYARVAEYHDDLQAQIGS